MGALSREELRAAVALAEVRELGPRRIAALVEATGSAVVALEAVASGRLPAIEDPEGRLGFPPKLRARLRNLRPVPEGRLRGWERRGIRLVARGGTGYPARLDHLGDPPAVLWLSGPGELPEGPAAAVVGTRKATEYGRRMARRIAGGLAAHGVAVVSGMATGIDGTAHRAALDAGGPTVGVLGSGLDRPYPRANAALFARMRRAGLLATEFPPSERPRRRHFPRRNRIIAALADAVVVVQAGVPSGALNTATHALELGREVLAVPGRADSKPSQGVHGLLRDGAGLAEGAEDVLRALGLKPEGEEKRGKAVGEAPTGPWRDAERAVWTRLGDGPRAADELAAGLGLPTGRALALLGRLELAGVVRSLPGGRYERGSSHGAGG